MAATLTQTKPAWIDRQPRWLLVSLAAAAFATVLAGCGAPTTQSAGPVGRPPTTVPVGTPPTGPVGSPPTTHSLPTLPRCSGGGVSTADHGCISAAEFVARRNHIAQQHLADPEYQEQKALEVINAHRAHASLEVVYGSGTKPGEGVTIGIIDTGVDLSPSELAAAAVSPVGTPRVTTGLQVDNGGHRVATTRLGLGSVLGDGFSRSTAGLELAAFDALGAPFWFELPALTELASPPHRSTDSAD